jgi:hypothetical protein
VTGIAIYLYSKMTTTINVTGALWYIAETAIPGPQKIKVYDFGHNQNTVCQIQGGTAVSCDLAIQYAKSGVASVYVPLDVVPRNHNYIPDDSAFRMALSLVVITGAILFIIGKP